MFTVAHGRNLHEAILFTNTIRIHMEVIFSYPSFRGRDRGSMRRPRKLAQRDARIAAHLFVNLLRGTSAQLEASVFFGESYLAGSVAFDGASQQRKNSPCMQNSCIPAS